MRTTTASLRILCIAVTLAGCAGAHRPPPPAPVFQAVAGTWGWVEGTHTCATNPHTITFSPDWRTMEFRYPSPVDSATGRRHARYEVRGHGPSSIRAFLLHEDRRDDQGTLVEWDLVLLSPDLYVWRRTDWKAEESTGAIERCAS